MVPSLRGTSPEKTACPAAAGGVLGPSLASVAPAGTKAERMRTTTTALRTRNCFACASRARARAIDDFHELKPCATVARDMVPRRSPSNVSLRFMRVPFSCLSMEPRRGGSEIGSLPCWGRRTRLRTVGAPLTLWDYPKGTAPGQVTAVS